VFGLVFLLAVEIHTTVTRRNRVTLRLACGAGIQRGQIVEQSSDDETVLVRSRKLEEVAEHLIDAGEKRILGLFSFEF